MDARQRLESLLRGRGWAAVLGVCLVVQCLPVLVTRVLPFHDAPGVIGLGGVFAHLDDPRTRVREFFDVDFGAYPSIAYFGWAYLAAQLHVPVDVAFNLFIALFCLAGPPLALLLVLRAFDRPPALALLALPIGYHHQIWFGFLGSAAAITGLLLALGFARRLVDRPRLANHLGLAASLLFVAIAHPFTLALTLAIVAPLVAWPVRDHQSRAARLAVRAARLACFLPTLLFLAAWARHFFAGGSSPAEGVSWTTHLSRELGQKRPPLTDDLQAFFQWLGGGYLGRVDDVVVAVALLALVAFLVFGVRGAPVASAAPTSRASALWLGWAALVLAAGYLLLPNKIYWPTYWWGLRVRCVVPLFLVAVAAVRITPRGLPAWALAPSALAALLFAGYVTADLRGHFRGQVLAGFDEALAAIPPGQSVLAFPVLPDPHYTRGHPYLVQYYVARTGGRAAPYLVGHPGSYWVTMKPAPAAPPWGDRAEFDWQEHGLGYDYFLVALPVGGPALDPLRAVPGDAVTLVSARGQWRLYRRERPPLPSDGGGRDRGQ